MKLTCQFRRFLARTFRPVLKTPGQPLVTTESKSPLHPKVPTSNHTPRHMCMLRLYRLAGKKFGHLAGMQIIFWEKVRRNKPKTANILIDKTGESRNSCIVKVGGVGVEDMMMSEEVGAHV